MRCGRLCSSLFVRSSCKFASGKYVWSVIQSIRTFSNPIEYIHVCPLSSGVSSWLCLPVLSGPLAKLSLQRKNVGTSLTLTLCISQRFKAMETVGKHAPFLDQGAHIHIFRQFARLFALLSFPDAASQDEKWMYSMYLARSWILEYHHSSMSILNLNLRKSLDQGAHAKERAQFSFALEQPGLRSSSWWRIQLIAAHSNSTCNTSMQSWPGCQLKEFNLSVKPLATQCTTRPRGSSKSSNPERSGIVWPRRMPLVNF